MHHGIENLPWSILLRNLRRARDASRDWESALVNIIAQLPVSNNIAELPGLAHHRPRYLSLKAFAALLRRSC